MPKASARLDAARKAYREALEAARAKPTPEAWARLLAAGKELSSAEESRPRSRRGRRAAPERVEPGEVERLEPAAPVEQASGEADDPA
ncbi:MAG TPA: hypothetical protein VFL83_21795 [Anaeromyxobacter sp.]|nr:hypothetical protein [Anaeromyxobacter sp.]